MNDYEEDEQSYKDLANVFELGDTIYHSVGVQESEDEWINYSIEGKHVPECQRSSVNVMLGMKDMKLEDLLERK